MQNTLDINDICDYIIIKIKSEGESVSLSNLKLQKLLYYTQAWHLAFYGESMFEGKFEAWVHGPVNRQIFERFKPSKMLYSEIERNDFKNENVFKVIPEEKQAHIESVLETYAQYTGAQLEYLSHNEKPWQLAREGYLPHQRCEVEINEDIMKEYYKTKLDV